MISAPANSEPDFYGAMIRAKIGPRRELMLRTATWPRGKGEIRRHREFCGTSETFADVPADSLRYLKELSKPKARRRVIEMEFGRTGERIQIIAKKIALGPRVQFHVPLGKVGSFALKAREC
jgi:hypothetical protein